MESPGTVLRVPSIAALRQAGFTLVELIIVIVLSVILAGVVAVFITRPIEGYMDMSRRATLVDIADGALRRMVRELRSALPNSIRVGCNGRCIELLHVVSGGRYRVQGSGDVLDFDATMGDTGFDVLGALYTAPAMGDSVVIYNLTATGPSANAYVGDNRASVGAGSTIDHVVLSPAFRFPRMSPGQRFYVVDTAVTFYCDLAAGVINRYSGYAIQAVQPTPPGVAPARLADHVADCSFAYAPGTPARSGLVTLMVTVADHGESVTLLHQAHTSNQP